MLAIQVFIHVLQDICHGYERMSMDASVAHDFSVIWIIMNRIKE